MSTVVRPWDAAWAGLLTCLVPVFRGILTEGPWFSNASPLTITARLAILPRSRHAPPGVPDANEEESMALL